MALPSATVATTTKARTAVAAIPAARTSSDRPLWAGLPSAPLSRVAGRGPLTEVAARHRPIMGRRGRPHPANRRTRGRPEVGHSHSMVPGGLLRDVEHDPVDLGAPRW